MSSLRRITRVKSLNNDLRFQNLNPVTPLKTNKKFDKAYDFTNMASI